MRYPLTLFFGVLTCLLMPVALLMWGAWLTLVALTAGTFVMESFRPRD